MPAPILCYNCQNHSAGLKRCSGCGKSWYCNSACQKSHWVEHIVDCTPRRPITTADHLALAVQKNTIPDDRQTRHDYGFASSLGPQGSKQVLELWSILLGKLKVSSKTAHGWQIGGTLAEEIRRAFSAAPELCDMKCYSWFLKNEFLFDGTHHSSLAEEEATYQKYVGERIIAAWITTGGSPRDTREEINTAIERLPCDLQQCHGLYWLVFNDSVPDPDLLLWLAFGFCACHPDNEMSLCHTYYDLVKKRCTFEEFCRAYLTSSLPTLFRTRGLLIDRFVEDVLCTPIKQLKLVWHLKCYILEDLGEEDGGGQIFPHSFVAVDYGFINCHTKEEVLELREVYRLFFWRRDADPLQLHTACKSGKLYEYLKGLMKLSPKSKFIRLLKNPYSPGNA